jgi:hypothetical protein
MSGFTRIELEFCKEFTDKLIKHPLALPYVRPVNPQLDNAPDYLERIQRPMDLGTIKTNLENNHYPNSRAWSADIQLVWQNAKLYNAKKTLLHESAERLSQKCQKMLKMIPKTEPELWALRLAKINHKIRVFLRENPPEFSIIPRKPELALKRSCE